MNKFGKTTASVGQIWLLVVGMICFAGLIGVFNAGGVEGGFLDKILGRSAAPPPPVAVAGDAGGGTILVNPGSSATNVLTNPLGGGAKDFGLWGNWDSSNQFTAIFKVRGYVGAIVSTAAWGFAAYGIAKVAAGLFGLDEEGEEEAFAKAAGFGVGAGRLAYVWQGAPKEAFFWKSTGFRLGYGTLAILIALYIFYDQYKKESERTFTFTCYAWDAPVGGSHCEKCNKQKGGLPCSEYQCRSLGQSCQLLNPGTGEEKCAWVNRNDVKPPVISLWEDALSDDYEYKPDTATHPEDRGVKIALKGSTTGCIKAFTPFSFGIHTDEPAKCKVDYLRKPKFEEMTFFFGGSPIFKYNHTQVMALPGTGGGINGSEGSLELQNDGQYELYTRCADSNGNENKGNFVFKFCVEQGPDTTPPLIVTTNLINGMPIAYNQSSLDLKLYTNEVAECKWSHLDEDYDEMPNEMSCARSASEFNAQLLYECETTLDAIKDREENKFYFRCKDQPGAGAEDRNTNSESYEFSLLGTEPLVIDEVGPNETVKDSVDPVKVTLTAKTSAGHNEGESVCLYSDEEDGNYIQFFSTNSHEHSQDLYLPEPDEEGETYVYYIKCVDLGGNSDVKSVEFEVESDDSAPFVARAYHEESHLKLVTNEEAECVYSLDSCDFAYDDGIKMTTVEENEHFIDWDTKQTIYVKCKDEYGNQPAGNQCSITVRAFEDFGGDE